MKIILKIITILLVASIVAGGFWLALNNTSTSTNNAQPPAMTNTNGQSNFQPRDRPDGSERSGSLTGGIGGIFFTLVQITGITATVLLIEKVYGMLSNRELSPAER